MTIKSLYIGVDFDGTMVEHKYPLMGNPLDGAIETVQELISAGHKIILYTMRSGERLADAIDYLECNGIKPYAVNENPSQKYWTTSPKIFCNVYIDDAALGTPMVIPNDKGRPCVDWERVRELLVEKECLSE